jgi:peptidoglycan/xylan/chitin deacetylase (PgdA/CDA1 family)
MLPVRLAWCGLLLAGLLGACRTAPSAVPAPAGHAQVPVRFLVTFDDGPSGAARDNTTEQVLETLARNRWQNGIKAVFFVQTRHPRFGGSEIGQRLMRRMHAEGHVLGLHTASPAGHVLHTRLSPAELDRMLETGIADIHRVTGDVPHFLRPPNWVLNARTVTRYEAHGLSLVMTDIRIKDGKTRGFHSSPGARRKIHADLQQAAQRLDRGELPVVAGYVPLVLTLHDPNPATARELESYLGMLIEEAHAVGLAVDRRPFSASLREVVMAASARATRPTYTAAARLPVYR